MRLGGAASHLAGVTPGPALTRPNSRTWKPMVSNTCPERDSASPRWAPRTPTAAERQFSPDPAESQPASCCAPQPLGPRAAPRGAARACTARRRPTPPVGCWKTSADGGHAPCHGLCRPGAPGAGGGGGGGGGRGAAGGAEQGDHRERPRWAARRPDESARPRRALGDPVAFLLSWASRAAWAIRGLSRPRGAFRGKEEMRAHS